MNCVDFFCRYSAIEAKLKRRLTRERTKLGERLKRARSKKITQGAIAEAAGVPTYYVCWLERQSKDAARIGDDALVRIAKVLSNLEEGWNSKST